MKRFYPSALALLLMGFTAPVHGDKAIAQTAAYAQLDHDDSAVEDPFPHQPESRPLLNLWGLDLHVSTPTEPPYDGVGLDRRFDDQPDARGTEFVGPDRPEEG
jgi:hypothetical protein